MIDVDGALTAKANGNEAYKRMDFVRAKRYYLLAINLNPNEITFRANLAAVLLEEKNYPNVVLICQGAIDVGKKNGGDARIIAKTYARMGKAYRHMHQLEEAKAAFEKALIEHRMAEYTTFLSEIESLIKKQAEAAYINPELAEEEKEKGNDLFKARDFSGAIQSYTEAIRRNPQDPKLYSNRAACYIMLKDFHLALIDADKAIELDRTFMRAYFRKAVAYNGLGKTSEEKCTYKQALKVDMKNAEAMEGYWNACRRETLKSFKKRLPKSGA